MCLYAFSLISGVSLPIASRYCNTKILGASETMVCSAHPLGICNSLQHKKSLSDMNNGIGLLSHLYSVARLHYQWEDNFQFLFLFFNNILAACRSALYSAARVQTTNQRMPMLRHTDGCVVSWHLDIIRTPRMHTLFPTHWVTVTVTVIFM